MREKMRQITWTEYNQFGEAKMFVAFTSDPKIIAEVEANPVRYAPVYLVGMMRLANGRLIEIYEEGQVSRSDH